MHNFPFEDCVGGSANWAAYQQLRWLQRQLTIPSIYNLAYAWRVGLTAVNHNLFSYRTGLFQDYATRVLNLYHDPRT